MITEYSDILKNKKAFERIKKSIRSTKGRIAIIVHPFNITYFGVRYPKKYERNLKQIVQKSKFLVFLLIEKRGTHKILLENENIKDKQIIVVETYPRDPTPTHPENIRDEEGRKFFVEMLTKLGVRRVLLGGELGKFFKETKHLTGGCVPLIAWSIKNYSKIKVTVMPEMLFMDEIYEHEK